MFIGLDFSYHNERLETDSSEDVDEIVLANMWMFVLLKQELLFYNRYCSA